MDRRTKRTVIGVVLAVALVFIGLPLLGLVIIFRQEIYSALVGPRELSSGVRLCYEWEPYEESGPAPDAEDLKARVLRRIDPGGRLGCQVEIGPGHELAVTVPETSAEAAKRLLRQPGHLEFRIVGDKTKDRAANFDRMIMLKQRGQPDEDPAWRWVRLKKGWEYYGNSSAQGGNPLDVWNFVYVVDQGNKAVEVLVKADDGQDVTGRDLAKAVASTQNGEPIVSFEMRPEAAARFATLTNPQNRGRHIAIILDGEVQSAPVLQATLSTAGIIQGYKDSREVAEVVQVLNSGELGVRLGDPVREERFGRP